MRIRTIRTGFLPAALVLAAATVLGIVTLHVSSTTPAVGGDVATPPAPQHFDRAVLDQFSSAFASAAKRVDPSVVAIFTEAETPVSSMLPGGGMPFELAPELRRFFRFHPESPGATAIRHGLGSGVIVRPDGCIVTNNHVIDGATKLVVRLADDRELPATVVGRDPQSDLAVIQVDADNLTAATLGDSDSLQVGEWVIAVGNPLEMFHTVTAGIVSATGRSSVGLSVYENFIQTDASINPGNSGGALADLDGNVVGINTAIASPTGMNVGIGFAIPIASARHVVDELIASGRVVRGFLALIPQDVDADLAKAMGLDSTRGALVADVSADGPADRAGIEPGDVIVAYQGKPIADAAVLRERVAESRPGSEVALRIVRDGREKTVRVGLGERPEPQDVASAGSGRGEGAGGSRGKLGLGVETLSPELAERLHVPATSGVLVERVEPGSAADRAGLHRGDVIANVGTRPVESAEQFIDAVRDASPGTSLALRVRRGAGAFYATVEVPAG